MQRYRVTRKFTSGILVGLTHTETTTVRFVVGKHYKECVGGGAYVVLACDEVAA